MKRIMRRFVMSEVSAVDKPAQTGAKAVILKRDGGADNMEQLPALIESVRSIYEDGELTPGERSAMLRETFSQYRDFTGRDGLADIAATRGETEDEEPEMGKVDIGALALLGLEGAATALRKSAPSLTREQAFSRACDEHPEILKIEREASRRRIAGVGIARTEPEILQTLSDEDIKRLIARERARFPFLDGEQLLAVVENSAEMRAHRAAFRAALQAGNRASTTLPSPQAVEVSKRDNALDALQAKAAELRKSDPSLTPEKAFAKAYRLHPDLAARERGASRAALYAV
jgi:hypothetical protein